MADATGLTDALSGAMAPICRRRRRHDPGRVLVDVAVVLADGGDCLSDVAALRDQPDLFGHIASTPTVWRVIEAIGEERLGAIRQARATARARAWPWRNNGTESGAKPLRRRARPSGYEPTVLWLARGRPPTEAFLRWP